MNILDKHYPEISFKTDAEDLKIMVDFITEAAFVNGNNLTIQMKASSALLKEIRHKISVKEQEKRGSTKKFLMKFKIYQIHALMITFGNNDWINRNKPFEKNTIMKYNNMFHEKLTGI